MDSYHAPEDPLVGVARHVAVTAALRRACPEMIFVGSAYSYLQDYLAHVAQWTVRTGKTDLVGIGRMALCYWQFPRDSLAGRPIQRRRVCRTFSHCTTGPRKGMISGCFLLDKDYSTSPAAKNLRAIRHRRS